MICCVDAVAGWCLRVSSVLEVEKSG